MEVPFWQKETLCKRASENLTVNGGPIEGIRLEECHLYLGIPYPSTFLLPQVPFFQLKEHSLTMFEQFPLVNFPVPL